MIKTLIQIRNHPYLILKTIISEIINWKKILFLSVCYKVLNVYEKILVKKNNFPVFYYKGIIDFSLAQ